MASKISINPAFKIYLSKEVVTATTLLLLQHTEKISKGRIQFREIATLSPYAWPSVKSLGRLSGKEDFDDDRTIYERDLNRLEHETAALSALEDKTQVFTKPILARITDRLTHCLRVRSIGKTIGRYLNLNIDLIEAGAMGHDLGHPPFGHEGEATLNDISLRVLGKPFKHNRHSLRIVDILEKKDLSAEVRNIIVCHDGEKCEKKLVPGKIPEKLDEMTDDRLPYTLEGCVVRIADQIAYLGHDLRDALTLKIITPQDLPEIVKEYVKEARGIDLEKIDPDEIPDIIINIMTWDVIRASAGKNYITMSDKMFEVREALFDFEYKKIIGDRRVQKTRKIIPAIIEGLYDYYTTRKKNTLTPQQAIDKIASLTDKKALKIFNKI